MSRGGERDPRGCATFLFVWKVIREILGLLWKLVRQYLTKWLSAIFLKVLLYAGVILGVTVLIVVLLTFLFA